MRDLIQDKMDITERMRAEAELRESKERYERLAADSRTIAWEVDTAGLYTYVSPVIEDVLGYRQEEIVGKLHFYDLHPEEGREAFKEEAFAAMQRKEAFLDLDNAIEAKDGGVVWVTTNGRAILEADGSLKGYSGSDKDITERKQAEENLRESELRFQQMLSLVPDMISIHDTDMNIVYSNWNGFGAVPEERQNLKTKCHKTYRGYDDICPDCQAKTVLETRKPFQTEAQLPDGRWIDLRVIPFLDEMGDVELFVEWVRDISERKQVEEAQRESLQRLEFALQAGKLGMWDWNPQDGAVVYSDLWAQMLEYRPDEVEPTVEFFKQHVHPEDLAAVLDRLTGHVEGRLPVYESEHRLQTKSGRWLWVLDRGKIAERDKDGRPVRVTGLIADITERKQAEEALRESEERFMKVLYASADAILLIGDNTFIDCNEATASMLGYDTREQFLQTHPSELSPETQPDGRNSREKADEMMRMAFERGFHRFEWIHLRADGEHFPVEVSLTPIIHNGRNLLYCIWRDITQEKLAEDALRKSEETHRALVEGLPDTVMRFDREGRHLFVSDNVRETVDMEAAQFIGKTHAEMGFPEAQCRFWEESIRRVFDNGAPFETEFTVEGKAGAATFNWRLVPERDAQGAVSSVLSISRDITAHRKVEQEYKTLFREMLDGFALHEIICDTSGTPVDYRFLAVNPAFERMTGLKAEAIVGRTVLEVLPGTERRWIETYGKGALSGKPGFFENHSAELGKHFEVTSFLPAPGQFACIIQDITERKRAEAEREKLQAQLTQAQKMESIGTLAGGIAHDLNNALTPIMVQTELAKLTIPADNPVQEGLDEIMKAGHRAKDLVKQILAFSRQSQQQRVSMDLTPMIKESLKLLRSSIPTTIEIRQDIETDPYPVVADPTQMQQIVMNLCTNAGQAIQEMGGALEVSLRSVELDEDEAKSYPNIGPGRYVVLTVSDTGVGIEPELMEKIFDPFFTTKPVNEGTGMGLSVVHGIVLSHEGDITVRSEPGKGSTFTVLLPRLEQETKTEPETIDQSVPAGNERVMFVDDEDSMVKAGEQMLKRLGYQVEVKTSAVEALEAFREQPDRYDLVMTDMTMPNMTGDNLAKALMRVRPDIPVIICTGFSHQIDEEKALDMGIRAFVMKPFVMKDMAITIRKVLDAEGENPAHP